MSSFVDYYAVLGVSSDASVEAIKAAFKKLALQYHPDLYKGQDAEERMREILEAYKNLNDPEKRRQYDARRSEYISDARAPRVSQQEMAGSQNGASRASTDVREQSSAARQQAKRGRFAFPTITLGYPVSLNLADSQYTLSPERAQMLLTMGLLRGTLSEPVQGAYVCHRCHHHWSASPGQTAPTRPRACPKCQAQDWDEYLLLRCVHCEAVFESEQIRYEIGSHAYGASGQKNAQGALCPPYELFPLCPQCGRSHWCPAEDQRVEALGAEAARKAAIARGAWFLVAVVVAVVLVVLVLTFR